MVSARITRPAALAARSLGLRQRVVTAALRGDAGASQQTLRAAEREAFGKAQLAQDGRRRACLDEAGASVTITRLWAIASEGALSTGASRSSGGATSPSSARLAVLWRDIHEPDHGESVPENGAGRGSA